MHISIRSGLLVLLLGGVAAAQPPAKNEELPPPPVFLRTLPLEPTNLPPPKPGEVLTITDPRIVSKPRPQFTARPDYPIASVRAREEGEVRVKVCVTETGEGHDVSLVQGSGFQRLDDASLLWADGASFVPAQTEAGPVAVCGYEFTYQWSMGGYDSDEAAFERYSAQPLFVLGPTTRGNPMFAELKDLAGATAPVITTMPDAPVYPANEDPAYAFARDEPVKMKACVGPAGRTMMLTRMSEMGPMATIFATNWLSGVRFAPAMKDGKAIGVCGVEVEMRWKQPG